MLATPKLTPEGDGILNTVSILAFIAPLFWIVDRGVYVSVTQLNTCSTTLQNYRTEHQRC